MAKLISCKVCGQPVAKSAKTCPHCGAKLKKSGLRMFFGTLLVFAGIILIAFSLAKSPSVDKAVSNAAEKVLSDAVTLENFNKINSSMTYEDVCALFGKEGTLDSEVDVAGIKTQLYHWYDITGIANCNVTFQNGRMTAKAQIGLKEKTATDGQIRDGPGGKKEGEISRANSAKTSGRRFIKRLHAFYMLGA